MDKALYSSSESDDSSDSNSGSDAFDTPLVLDSVNVAVPVAEVQTPLTLGPMMIQKAMTKRKRQMFEDGTALALLNEGSKKKRQKKPKVPIEERAKTYMPAYTATVLALQPEPSSAIEPVRIVGTPMSVGSMFPMIGFTRFPELEKYIRETLPNPPKPKRNSNIKEVRAMFDLYQVPKANQIPYEERRQERGFGGCNKTYIKQQFQLKSPMCLFIDEYSRLFHVLYTVLRMIMFGNLSVHKDPRQMGHVSKQWDDVIERTCRPQYTVESVSADGVEQRKPVIDKDGDYKNGSPLKHNENLFKVYAMCLKLEETYNNRLPKRTPEEIEQQMSGIRELQQREHPEFSGKKLPPGYLEHYEHLQTLTTATEEEEEQEQQNHDQKEDTKDASLAKEDN